MIHLQLASLMDPMNIVAADSEEKKIYALNKFSQELLMEENCTNNSLGLNQ